MADIRRIELTQPPGPRMSRAVVHENRVFLAGLTAADTSQDIDHARVAELRQAISEGRLHVDTDRIADRLIASVRDLLGHGQ